MAQNVNSEEDQVAMRLSHDDWRRVSAFLQELYTQANADAFRHTVLAGLSQLIPCELAGYNEIDNRTNAFVFLLHPNPPERFFAVASLLAVHFSEHPQLQYYRQSSDRRPYQTTDFVSLRQFRQMGIYQEVYRHMETDHQLTCLLSEFGEAGDIGIGLNRKQKKFSKRDLTVLELLRPHLIRARHNTNAITATEERVQSLTSTLDTMSAGLAIVNNAGRIVWATPQVMPWLELYFPNSRKHPDRLPDNLERWMRAQLSALNQATALATAPTAFVTHHQRSTLTVRFQPVPEGATRLIFSEQCELLAMNRAREFGLTVREAEVLHWVGEAKSNPEIALLLQISLRTVHKHVEHILAKLGVETRLAAIRQVSTR